MIVIWYTPKSSYIYLISTVLFIHHPHNISRNTSTAWHSSLTHYLKFYLLSDLYQRRSLVMLVALQLLNLIQQLVQSVKAIFDPFDLFQAMHIGIFQNIA